jgi:hypothetical protein
MAPPAINEGQWRGTELSAANAAIPPEAEHSKA